VTGRLSGSEVIGRHTLRVIGSAVRAAATRRRWSAGRALAATTGAPRHVLARVRDSFTNLCVPLRRLPLGFPGGGLEMVLDLREMRVVPGPGCLGLVLV